MMDVIYCKKCHDRKRIKSYESVVDEIKATTGCEYVDDVCMSYCGPGAKEHFVVVDDEIIATDSYEELIKELKNF